MGARAWATELLCLILALAPVYPLGALPTGLAADADKLCPFATNLGSLAASTGHRPGQDTPPPRAPSWRIPSPRLLSLESESTAHAGVPVLSAPHPPTLAGLPLPRKKSPADRPLSVPDSRKAAPLLPSFAGYTLEPVTALQVPKRNEKRTKEKIPAMVRRCQRCSYRFYPSGINA